MGFPHVTERLLLIFWLEHFDQSLLLMVVA
jgi:hypothetical protein